MARHTKLRQPLISPHAPTPPKPPDVSHLFAQPLPEVPSPAQLADAQQTLVDYYKAQQAAQDVKSVIANAAADAALTPQLTVGSLRRLLEAHGDDLPDDAPVLIGRSSRYPASAAALTLRDPGNPVREGKRDLALVVDTPESLIRIPDASYQPVQNVAATLDSIDSLETIARAVLGPGAQQVTGELPSALQPSPVRERSHAKVRDNLKAEAMDRLEQLARRVANSQRRLPGRIYDPRSSRDVRLDDLEEATCRGILSRLQTCTCPGTTNSPCVWCEEQVMHRFHERCRVHVYPQPPVVTTQQFVTHEPGAL